jgi:hypothetical protein
MKPVQTVSTSPTDPSGGIRPAVAPAAYGSVMPAVQRNYIVAPTRNAFSR